MSHKKFQQRYDHTNCRSEVVQDKNELPMCIVVDKDRTEAFGMISRDLSNTALLGPFGLKSQEEQ
mgnify:FL=1